MAPRGTMSVSTTSSSLYAEDATEATEFASIDVVSLDDPSKMSPQAILAELKYYGVDAPSTMNDRSQLEDTLKFHRRRSQSGGSGSPRGDSGDNNNNNSGSGGRGGGVRQREPPHQQHPQYQRQREMMQRGPTPEQPPTQHLEQTAANVPGVRVTTPPTSSQQQYQKYNENRKYSASNSGDKPTHIPLTPSNRIPPQILNIIRISADPTMKAINLDDRRLGDREVIRLVEALEKNRTVEFLSLRNCDVTDEAVGKIGDMLLRNAKLAELHLDSNRITAEGAAALSTALITNETLAVLTLNDNRGVGDRGVVYLIGALEHNTALRTLGVERCGVNEGGSGGSKASGSRKAVNRLEQIESLLADRQIDANFESLLERLLDDDFRVTGIDLSGRRIGDKGAIRLAEALADNTQVRQLWLRGCNVGDPGARALASCLEQNMAVVDLFLGNNSIGDTGLVAISDALVSSNLTLVSLEMNDNRVEESGLDAFVQALEKNTSVLVASFDGNPCAMDSGKIESLQAMLTAKRNGLNLVSFVVDPDAGSTVCSNGGEGGNGGPGLINMSVCSSYMPSTYRRAGISSQAGGNNWRGSGGGKDLHKAANAAGGARGSNESHKYSVYNRSPNVPAPPPPPPPRQRSPPAQQKAALVPRSSNSGNARSNKSGSSGKNRSGSCSDNNRSGSGGGSPKQMPVVTKKAAPSPAPPPTPVAKAPKKKKAPQRAPSPPPFARSNPYQRAHVPVPLKAQALETIAESEARSTATPRSRSSAVSSRNGQSSAVQKSVSAALTSQKYPSQQTELPGVSETDTITTPVAEKRRRITMTTDLVHNINDHATVGHTTITESIQHPETQHNFNMTLKKLWRRVEMMKRTNHFAAAHYRARHFWFWFVPISSSIFVSILLSLATAADYTGRSRLVLSLVTGFFAAIAFFLNFLQSTPRFRGGSWSVSRAEVHRSAEVELGQVAFRLDTLGKYDGNGLTTGSHSTKSRANAIRDLYRIDVYLQAMQRCTPDVPKSINETFYLLAQRLKAICRKYPNAVKLRSATYAYYEDEVSDENPVPVEMQIDALDLLGREIQSYFLYPLFMPNARDVVSRTIDIFFAKSEEDGSGERGGSGTTTTDSRYYSEYSQDGDSQIV